MEALTGSYHNGLVSAVCLHNRDALILFAFLIPSSADDILMLISQNKKNHPPNLILHHIDASVKASYY